MSESGERKYSKEHEWVLEEDGKMIVGISDYAQQELGDVVFVDLPEVGSEINQGESFTTVESVKAVSDLYAPLDGIIAEVNEQLGDTPELINASPEDKGWVVKVDISDPSQAESLMTAEEYASFVKELSE